MAGRRDRKIQGGEDRLRRRRRNRISQITDDRNVAEEAEEHHRAVDARGRVAYIVHQSPSRVNDRY